METQRCSNCGEVKPLEEFNFKNRLLGKRHIHCVECQKIYKRNHYLRHLEAYKKKSAQQKDEVTIRNHLLVFEYLKSHPCVDCGEADVVVLEFDHIRDKDRTIAALVNDGVSWEKILAEIQKCEVRCANCHRRKTAKQFNWYKKLGL